MNKIVVGMAADHAGFALKESLKKVLEAKGFSVVDFGTNSEESMDYPDVAHPLAAALENGEVAFGVAMCGTGNGISMTLNKHQGIRAALCWSPEIASLAKEHNNANILVLPARFVTTEEGIAILHSYLETEFAGGRHQRRIDKIPC
ncbi:MAG: ribose 5-phosphate isomerase B [Bacteroidales bacterium]|nr:ribose 5-phosphate isomerase B [Bacteroidales bacterium]